MSNRPSDLVRMVVLRELEDGIRHDALWLQALSEEKLDQAKARDRYIALRCQVLQSDVKGLLVKQIRGAIAEDTKSKNKGLADFLSQRDLSKTKR
jgi:hypothetical protein